MQTTLTPREAYNNVETEQEMVEWLKATCDTMLEELSAFKWDPAAPGTHIEKSTALAKQIDYHGMGLECLSKMRARMLHEIADRPHVDLVAKYPHLFNRLR